MWPVQRTGLQLPTASHKDTGWSSSISKDESSGRWLGVRRVLLSNSLRSHATKPPSAHEDLQRQGQGCWWGQEMLRLLTVLSTLPSSALNNCEFPCRKLD